MVAKKKVKKAKPSRRTASKPHVVKAKPHSRIELIISKKELGKAPVEKHFILHDGRRIESLFQLVDELESMSEETFRNYVNEWKNDFAKWARDVFEVPSLAEEIQNVRDRIETQRAVMKHLLREVARIASKEHREEIKQQVARKPKAVKLASR